MFPRAHSPGERTLCGAGRAASRPSPEILQPPRPGAKTGQSVSDFCVVYMCWGGVCVCALRGSVCVCVCVGGGGGESVCMCVGVVIAGTGNDGVCSAACMMRWWHRGLWTGD